MEEHRYQGIGMKNRTPKHQEEQDTQTLRPPIRFIIGDWKNTYIKGLEPAVGGR